MGILRKRKERKSNRQKQKELIRHHNKKTIQAEQENGQLGMKNKSGKPLSVDVKNAILYNYDSYIQNGLFPKDVSNI